MARKPTLTFQPPALGAAVGFDNGPGGLAVRDGSEPGHWARIKGAAGGFKYGHVPVAPVGDGTWVEMPSSPEVPAGTAAYLPAVEVNQNAGVPTDGSVVVWLVPDDTVPGYRFFYGPGATTTTTTTPAPCTGDCQWKWYAADKLWRKVSGSCPTGCVCSAPAVCSGVEDGCVMAVPCVRASQFRRSGACVDWDHDPAPCWTCGGYPAGDTATDGVRGPVKAKCFNTSTPQWPCDVLPALTGSDSVGEYGQGVCVCVSADGTRSLVNNPTKEDCGSLCRQFVPQFDQNGVSGAALYFDCACHDSQDDCLGTCCTDADCQGGCVYDPATGAVLENNCTGCGNCDCPPPPTTLTTPPPGQCFVLSAGCAPGTTSTTTNPPPWYCAADPAYNARFPLGACNAPGYFAAGVRIKGCFQTPSIPAGWVKCSGPYGDANLCGNNCAGTTTTCAPKWFCVTPADGTCAADAVCKQLPVRAPDCATPDLTDPTDGTCSGPYDTQAACQAGCANATTTASPQFYCYSCREYDGWGNPVGPAFSSCSNYDPTGAASCTQASGPYPGDSTCGGACTGTTTTPAPSTTPAPTTTPAPSTTVSPRTGSWICNCASCGWCPPNALCADFGCGAWVTQADCAANCGASSTTPNPFTTAAPSTAAP